MGTSGSEAGHGENSVKGMLPSEFSLWAAGVPSCWGIDDTLQNMPPNYPQGKARKLVCLFCLLYTFS